jgi:hypothetical protein
VFTLAFGLAWYLTRQWWLVFPLVFAGILPLVEGLRRLARDRPPPPARAAEQAQLTTAQAEKQILITAREAKGIVTPAMVALKTELSIEEAQGLLEQMARKGYAVMHLRDNGRIEYEFPEFH